MNLVNGAAFKPDDWGVEGVPIVRIENLNGLDQFNCAVRKVDRRYYIRGGDLVFAWSGNRGTSFGPFVWWREGLHYLNQHIFAVREYHCDGQWLFWVLKGVTRFVERQAHGIIGLVHITRQALGVIPIPWVPPEEQQAIADHLDQETAKLDALIGKVREAIERLQEYRTALVSAAVTGKIDVRESGA